MHHHRRPTPGLSAGLREDEECWRTDPGLGVAEKLAGGGRCFVTGQALAGGGTLVNRSSSAAGCRDFWRNAVDPQQPRASSIHASVCGRISTAVKYMPSQSGTLSSRGKPPALQVCHLRQVSHSRHQLRRLRTSRAATTRFPRGGCTSPVQGPT
jgi:hypothetical protein